MSFGFGSNPNLGWQKLQNFCRLFGTEVAKDLDTSVEKDVRALSQKQNRDAPRKTGYMASQVKYVKEGPGINSAVADAYYSIFVDQGTFRMAGRPFFTDNMNQWMPKIADNANIALGLTIKRLLA